MTDWTNCPAVERNPPQDQRYVGVRRNEDSAVRAARKPRRRRHGRRVRRMVSGCKRATGSRRPRTRGSAFENSSGALTETMNPPRSTPNGQFI